MPFSTLINYSANMCWTSYEPTLVYDNHVLLVVGMSSINKGPFTWVPSLMPRSHQTFRHVPTVKLLGIMFINRCWPTLFTLLQLEMLTDGVLNGQCDQPIKLRVTRSIHVILGIESREVGDLPLQTRSQVWSHKYDMNAYMATLFGGDAHDMCWHIMLFS